jgi:hypothetical protein
MGTLLAISVFALSSMVGADHPSSPVHNDGWPKGIDALVNGKERVHGYFVNWEDVFFFKGDTRRFNSFLRDYAKTPGVRRRLVLHKGKLAVRSPWDKEPRKIEANWQLYVNAATNPDLLPNGGENAVLDLWLDGTVSEKKLEIPANVKVEYAEAVKRKL